MFYLFERTSYKRLFLNWFPCCQEASPKPHRLRDGRGHPVPVPFASPTSSGQLQNEHLAEPTVKSAVKTSIVWAQTWTVRPWKKKQGKLDKGLRILTIRQACFLCIMGFDLHLQIFQGTFSSFFCQGHSLTSWLRSDKHEMSTKWSPKPLQAPKPYHFWGGTWGHHYFSPDVHLQKDKVAFPIQLEDGKDSRRVGFAVFIASWCWDFVWPQMDPSGKMSWRFHECLRYICHDNSETTYSKQQ